MQRDQTVDHENYGVSESNDTKHIAKLLGDAMKSGAHKKVFFTALAFVFWYRALAFEEREE